MKKFAFRLQRVLNVREAHEKIRLGELGREQRRLMDEETRLSLFESEQDFQLAEVRSDRQREVPVWSLRINANYLQRIAQVVEFQQGRVDAQAQSVSRAQTCYHDARRDTRVLEKLRDTKMDEWKRDTLLEESKVLDEIGGRKPDGEESC